MGLKPDLAELGTAHPWGVTLLFSMVDHITCALSSLQKTSLVASRYIIYEFAQAEFSHIPDISTVL